MKAKGPDGKQAEKQLKAAKDNNAKLIIKIKKDGNDKFEKTKKFYEDFAEKNKPDVEIIVI